MTSALKSTKKLAAAIAVIALIFLACGQKPGVSQQFGAAGALPPGFTVDPETGQILDAQGNVVGTTEGGLGDFAGGTGGTGDTNTSTTGDADPNAPGGGTDPNDPGTAGGPGNSSGVTDTLVKIGSHAPLTGAAPVPSESATKGARLYWEWLRHNKRDIHGRYVEALLKNDNYNPSQAVAVCKEMVEQDKVFWLSGVAGADQIQACARYAASVGVPYISAGVTEIGLDNLPNYLAVTMTYPDQAPLLVDTLADDLGGKGEKNGMLYYDTPNFSDAHDAFESAMKRRGLSFDYDRGVCKCAGSTDAQTVVQEMRTQGIENVYVLAAPVWWIQVLKAADTQNYHPQWIGVGISMTFDTVARAGCPAIDKAKYFSPFPAWIDIARFDDEFYKAAETIYDTRGDDFYVLGWSAAKVGAELLERAGRNLTREGFIQSSVNAKNVQTGTFPTLNFTPEDRFGASTVTVAEARCSTNRWHTIQPYTNSF